MKEISFWKTQWWRMLAALLCLTMSIVTAFTSTAVADSVNGLCILVGDVISSLIWLGGFIIWCLTAFITHHEDRIEALQKRIEILETCAITEIVEESPKHYVVKRRLGPDKEN